MKPERIQVRLSAGSARADGSKILGLIRETIEEITGSPYALGEMRDVDCTSANCLRLFGLGDLDPEWGRHLDLVVDVRSEGGAEWVSISINGHPRKVWVRAFELKAAAKDPELGQCSELVVTDCESLTDVSPLSRLTQLTSLDLGGCKSLTDVGPLSGLTQLMSLDLSSCESLTDVGPLSGLMQLTSLDLGGCKSLTDVGPLSGLTQLTSLNLGWC
jgi:Leucine-rich repeat (LRR) protein